LYFLPQKPYLVLGSLRQQLLYPKLLYPKLLYPKLLYPTLVRQGETVDTCRADQSLHQMLDQVNLSYLLDRWGGLDADPDWSKVLSLGEQQRLAMARLLLAKPQYALLDEATSALDEASEAYLYGLLDATAIAYISVGHRPTLTTYHQQVLQLRRDRSWSLNAV
jgi:vitamin B12/bleomycin/antimicrobial peptide transport system ATP-binding/permease protein